MAIQMVGLRGIGLLAMAATLLTGCVSLEEHDRMKWANRTLESKNAELQQELTDARNVSETLRSRVESCEGAQGDKDRLVSSLQGENDRILRDAEQAKGLLERLANQPVSPVVVVERKLPAALDTALREFAQSHPNMVVYDEKNGVVKWTADVLFPSGSDQVDGKALQALQDFTQILKSPAAADFETVVVGHTDNRQIKREETLRYHATNWHLSSHRAIGVGNVILGSGYEPSRLAVVGCGEYRPVADNASETGKSQNRRVDIYLIPRGTLIASSTSRTRAG